MYVDDQVALVPFKPSIDHAAFFKVFDWRIWLLLLMLTPAYIVVCGLSDKFFTGKFNWWGQFEFTLRTIVMHPPNIPPQVGNYKKILSLTWVWSTFILVAAHSGNLCKKLSKLYQYQ